MAFKALGSEVNIEARVKLVTRVVSAGIKALPCPAFPLHP